MSSSHVSRTLSSRLQVVELQPRCPLVEVLECLVLAWILAGVWDQAAQLLGDPAGFLLLLVLCERPQGVGDRPGVAAAGGLGELQHESACVLQWRAPYCTGVVPVYWRCGASRSGCRLR